MFDSFLHNFRVAIRSLRKRPLFLLVPLLSLTIGIGANTAIFSGVSRLLLRNMEGVPNASRIVEIGGGRDGSNSLTYPDFLALREEADPLQEIAGFDLRIMTFSREEAGERVFGFLVSANYFEVLGLQAAMGRTFRPEEDEGADEHPVTVLSYQFWQNHLGGDPDVLNSTVYVSRQPYTVVGVAPEGFRGHMALGSPDLYVPLMQAPSMNEGNNWFDLRTTSWFQAIGLLRPSATLTEADAAVKTVYQRLAEEFPDSNLNRTALVRKYGSLPAVMRGPAGMFLGVLMAFVGLILLITCANVAGMFLARATARRKEIAIRLSVGASHGQIVNQLLVESAVVFLAGGVMGVLVARWALSVLASVNLPAPYPVALDISPDWLSLAFAGGLTLITSLVFGLLPARQALDLDLLSTLKDESGRSGSAEGRLRRWFVASQVASSLVLLVAASLLLRALQHAGEIETGFNAENTYLTFLDLKTEGLSREEGAVFQEELLSYFDSQPWVESVALAIDLPLDLSSNSTSVSPLGWTGGEGGRDYFSAGFNYVTPDYFETLQLPLVAGRGFTPMDRFGAETVAVVSRAFVERVWPGEVGVGRQVRWGGPDDPPLTVVGVAEDVQTQLLTDPVEPFIYRPLAQSYSASTNLVVRTRAELGQVTQGLHEGLRTLDPNISLSPVIGLQQFNDVGILPQRIAGVLSTSLGLLALLLSGMGVYGVMAYSVTRRTKETGIRIALGAEPGRVLNTVLVGAFRLVLPGLLVGVVLAIGVGFLLRSLLLGVSPADPAALTLVFLALAGMVLAGSFFPARRASRIDPADALRYD